MPIRLPRYPYQPKFKHALRNAAPVLIVLAMLAAPICEAQTLASPSMQAQATVATQGDPVDQGASSSAEDAVEPVPNAPLTKPEIFSIPVAHEGLFGSDVEMVTLVYKPAGPGPFPVVIYSHGRSGSPAVRARLRLPISQVQIDYWLEKNFAVVAPIRVGYGKTHGPDVEAHGSSSGHNSQPDYTRTAGAASTAILATLAWVRTQPWVDGHRMILEGQSVGGLGTVTAAATRPEGVVGYINFGGGAGGDPDRSPGRSNDPEQLTKLYSDFGKQTVMPNLWVYAVNDQYWGPDVPVAWHDGFAAGGSPSEFIHAPAVADGDGHGLSHHARQYWAPYVDAFLHRLGF